MCLPSLRPLAGDPSLPSADVKAASFVFERAESVEEAVALLAQYGDEAKVIAGGQSLVAMMNLRLARPGVLIDINRLPGLAYVIRDEDSLRVGGLTRHRTLEQYPVVIPGFEVVQQAASFIGHLPIRTRGTFGGSVAHADPTAEWCLITTLLDGQIVVAGPAGRRVIPADAFFQGFLSTALAPDEMIVEVQLRHAAQAGAIREFSRRHGDFAVVAIAVALDVVDGVCRNVRIAAGGVANMPIRLHAGELALEGGVPTAAAVAAAADEAVSGLEPPADVSGSASYRRSLARGLVCSALEGALDSAGIRRAEQHAGR
jgi:carbon-monoxide dehydrogenase medium subunit